MTSDRKIAANRLNAKKSSGPRTLRGKLQSSRNAWRRGLAITTNPEATVSTDVKRMANMICRDQRTYPGLYDLAVSIAQWQIVLLKVRDARNARTEPMSTIDLKIARAEQLAPALRSDEESARLDRYEQRARSARNRAIRMFQAISLVGPFLGHEAKGR